MKKTIKAGIILISLSGILYVGHTVSEKSSMNDLALENIEALAFGEDGKPSENFKCINPGEIDCYGYKVEYKYSGFSLD